MLCKYLSNRESLGFSTSCFSASHHAPVTKVDLSFMLKDFKSFTSDESSTVDDDGMCVPPLACSFAKMQQHQHIFGVVDEDGFLVLHNSLKTGNASVIKTWQVHTNAVFDLEWLQHENKILTGSGDQTIALHDVSTFSKIDVFKGHASSIKSISSHTTNDAVFVSGSRDGHIMMWDKRITRRDGVIPPVNTIYNAHMLQPHQSYGKLRKKRTSSGLRDAQQSVTSVLFQNENYIISAGAVDGCLKVWDTRKTYKVKLTGASPVHVFSYSGSNLRRHGYTSLVLDSRRLRLFASCTDDAIYEYNLASYDPNPVQSWRGHKNSTFYVKTAMSPDDQFLLSGSSDEKAYIWQINKPNSSPFVLESHRAEVTSVAWCPNDITKVVTLSDDTKIKLWRIYCRELMEDLLPDRCGQARKLSNERATSTEVKANIKAESHPTLLGTPKPLLLKASSAPAPAQSCMRTWLKTRVCSPIETAKKQSRLRNNVQSSESDGPSCSVNNLAQTNKDCFGNQVNDSLKACMTSGKSESNSTNNSDVRPCHRSDRHDINVVCSNCGKDKNTRLSSPQPSSSSDTVSSSCDQSGNTSSESDLYSPMCLPRTSLSKTNVSVTGPPVFKSHEHPTASLEIENVSPKKLKRRLNSNSPGSSPKRQCLTNIEPNNQAQDMCSVKKSLFSKDDTIVNFDSMTSTGVESKSSVTNIAALVSSNKSKEEARNTESCGKRLSSITQTADDEDLNSPTLNLPNLVLDEANNLKATPGQEKNEGSPRLDWLTRLRMERQRSSPDSKQGVGTSPKGTKGMKKIQSYFKPKNT
ncbi:denticleless protein homolog [Elysia marginata]|uniref:Denticleless protein homolog n=1 Tax=Elysia marginata TaxID=1093978 RepID=A0AAV4IJF4_9GAST|nr:denticleless protein homolog [Elysia marginata]